MTIIYKPKGRAGEYSHLAINHYTGCGHGCRYCYGPAATKNPDFHRIQAPRADIIAKLQKEALKHAGCDERVLLCFTSDPYQPLNDRIGLTRQVIEVLKAHDIPFHILTKGGLRAAADFDLYGKYDAFATTLTLLDDNESAKQEPNAALAAERIAAISQAHERGIETWVSLEPVLDPEVSLHIIGLTHEIVDHYKIGKLNHVETERPFSEWRNFGSEAIRLCRRYEKSYYVKDDLAKYLDGVHFTNTDTRKIKRKAHKAERSLF